MPSVEKVYACITCEDRLLVFRHVDFPNAGIQVPGGTMEAGETPEVAVLREASEETGLAELVVNKYLGRDEYQDTSTDPNNLLARHIFQLISPGELPETWQHYEQHPSDGMPTLILFEFYWQPLVEAVEKLDRYFSAMLDLLPHNIVRDQ